MLNFRFCLPRINNSLGGAGLGNELIPYAKAFIASRVLNFRLLHPAWGLNRRKYYRYFGTSRLDWLGYKALGLCMPSVTFTLEDYLRIGKKDYEEAIRCFAEEKQLRNATTLLLYTEGMWGGTYEIRKAAGFMWRELYKAKGAAENLFEVENQIPRNNIKVAVHVRRGDFKKSSGDAQDIRGFFNKAIPLDWYINVCLNLKKHFKGRISFILLTDGTREDVSGFINAIDPITTLHQQYGDCSDLLIAASADVLVCSISAFSIIAATLSNKPYIWYGPHLQNCDGYWTIWGDSLEDKSSRMVEAMEKYESMLKQGSLKKLATRGVMVGRDGVISQARVEAMLSGERSLVDEFDLVMHGAVPSQLA